MQGHFKEHSQILVFDSRLMDLQLSGSCLITSLNYGLPPPKDDVLRNIYNNFTYNFKGFLVP